MIRLCCRRCKGEGLILLSARIGGYGRGWQIAGLCPDCFNRKLAQIEKSSYAPLMGRFE